MQVQNLFLGGNLAAIWGHLSRRLLGAIVIFHRPRSFRLLSYATYSFSPYMTGYIILDGQALSIQIQSSYSCTPNGPRPLLESTMLPVKSQSITCQRDALILLVFSAKARSSDRHPPGQYQISTTQGKAIWIESF